MTNYRWQLIFGEGPSRGQKAPWLGLSRQLLVTLPDGFPYRLLCKIRQSCVWVE
ncbi:MAG: hypothetical protein IJU79_02750 [Desulfovibrionaceae bacterium]|nr:hypothetical protein [Desulfovibrionaceae bacterium]